MEINMFIGLTDMLITPACGIFLSVHSYEKYKKQHLNQILFCLLCLPGNLGLFLSSYFTKFSVWMCVSVAVYYFILEYCFYDISFFRLFVRHWFFWLHLLYIREFIIYCCSMLLKISLSEYTAADFPWHWIHILVTALTLIISIVFCIFAKTLKNPAIKQEKYTILLAFYLFIEFLIGQNVLFAWLPKHSLLMTDHIRIVGFGILLLLILGVIFCLLLLHMDKQEYFAVIAHNHQMMCRQYQLMQEIYEQKRKQVHDNVQHNIFLLETLKKGDTETAIQYLKTYTLPDKFCPPDQSPVSEQTDEKNYYTGIPVIDIMLDYKFREAEAFQIPITFKSDLCFCPLQPHHMCIILGNLLDNAMEASKDMESGNRRIHLIMRTVNNMFLLRIQNGYQGKRSKLRQKYITTKRDAEAHGIGLESISSILGQYSSSMEIDDQNHIFTVTILINKIDF